MTAQTDLDGAIAAAHRIVDDALSTHLDGHRLAGSVVLFSGGRDSTVLAHLMRERVDCAAHANTTIGIERTRQFVRDTCAGWDLPLLERSGPQTYAEIVLERGGFPGPAMHFKMYQRLKERALRQVRREFVIHPRQERVLFIAGIRRAESARRAAAPEHERVDSVIWASPLTHWSNAEMAEYIERFDVPRNQVAVDLGMSGECLCGAFAQPGEFEAIAAVDDDAANAILAIERDLHDAGHEGPRCHWGWGAYRADPDGQPPKTGPLCSSCDDRRALVREEPSPALARVLARRRGGVTS